MVLVSSDVAPPPRGILWLHAAAVAKDGGAWLFLGPPRAGKSTLCQLLQGYTSLLAEDKVFLIPPGNGGWTVADASAYSIDVLPSEGNLALSRGIPLRAVFRIYQSSEPSLKRISPLETCSLLTEAFFELFWQKKFSTEVQRYAFASLANIARSVPGYQVFFDRSPQAIDLFRNEFGIQDNLW